MHKYWGFGLSILSEIEFPELLPSEFTDADITITIGTVPISLDGGNIIRKPFSKISKDEFLLSVKNVCNYYAGFGNKIVVEPAPGIDLLSVRLFLLGTVMAAILYQRGSIPIHASAIVKDGKLILFAGNSGAGKSTLLATLATKGYKIFTDDICVLKPSEKAGNELYGTASYPMMKLWEDAIVNLENETFTRDFKVRPQLPKYGTFFYDNFNIRSLPLTKIFILEPLNYINDIQVNKLVNTDAFKVLEKQAYKHNLIANTELRMLYFSILSRLVVHIPIYEVKRPIAGTNAGQLCDFLENLF